MRIILLLVACLVFLPVLRSQEAEVIYQLEGVEIVSDRLGNREARTGRHTTVISGEEIRKLPASSLDDLLRSIPFLETQSRGALGVQSDILMRGGTFNQVLVLLDGMRINDPLTGHFNSYIPVSLPEIERIEVYRGPASSLYGPDAVGGVIHIITRNFIPGEEDENVEGMVETWYGQHNLFRMNSGLHMKKGKLRIGAGISFNRSDGHPLDTDSLRGDFRLGTASVSAAYSISDNIETGIRTAYDNRLFNARYFYTASPLDISREHIIKLWNQLFMRIRLNSMNTLSLQAAFQTTADSFLFNPVFPANTHVTKYHNYQVNHRYTGPGELRITAGVQADRKEIQSSDRGSHIIWHSGVYAVFSSRIGSGGIVSGGLRVDYDPLYGLEFLPQLNAAWQSGQWNFRGAAGRSIRAPDFTERFISTGLSGPLSPGRNLGNPALGAERSWSLETGIDRVLFSDIILKSSVYYRFSRDLIDYTLTLSDLIPGNGNLYPGEYYFHAGNLSLMNTMGLEVEAEGKHKLTGKNELHWGISWQALESRSEDGTMPSKYLSNHARNLFHANLGLAGGSARIQISSLFKRRDPESVEAIGQTLEPSYILFNLRSDKYLLESRLILSIQVNNLLNGTYTDVLGAQMPGRWFSGGLTWNFTDK